MKGEWAGSVEGGAWSGRGVQGSGWGAADDGGPPKADKPGRTPRKRRASLQFGGGALRLYLCGVYFKWFVDRIL